MQNFSMSSSTGNTEAESFIFFQIIFSVMIIPGHFIL